MPLPNPSKTVSRRVKKPKPLLFSFSQPEHLNLDAPTKLPRERRVRVICTDPDATDSSSDEETIDVPLRHKLASKRLVHEICFPASPPVSSEFQQERICVKLASSGLAMENGFKHARKEVDLLDFYKRTNADVVGTCAGGPSVQNVSSGCSGVGLWDFYERTNAGDVGACAGDTAVQNLRSGCSGASLRGFCEGAYADNVGACTDNVQNVSSGCSGMEEIAQFLSEFFAGPEEGGIPVWDEELDLLDDDAFNNVPNFELDFESATWMNSVPSFV